ARALPEDWSAGPVKRAGAGARVSAASRSLRPNEGVVVEPRRLRSWAGACLKAIDTLVYPWDCPVCSGRAEDSPFCAGCRRELLEASEGAACERCAMPLGPWAERAGGCSD